MSTSQRHPGRGGGGGLNPPWVPWPSPMSWQGLCLQRGSTFSQFAQSSPRDWLNPQGSSCTCPQPGGPGTEGCGKNLLATWVYWPGVVPRCPPAPAHPPLPAEEKEPERGLALLLVEGLPSALGEQGEQGHCRIRMEITLGGGGIGFTREVTCSSFLIFSHRCVGQEAGAH